MRRTIFLFFFQVLLSSVFAQTTRLDFDKRGEESDEESSYYFVIGKKNKQGNFYDSLFSWYTKSGRLRSVEIRDGHGNPTGAYKTFYESGKLKAVGQYEKKKFKIFQTSPDSIEQFVFEFYDSAGRVQVKRGTGLMNGRPDYLREMGRIINGARDSVWTCWYDNGKVFYHESWHNGELVDGISYDQNGSEYYYKTNALAPEPLNGLSSFYEKISSQIEYPREAEKRGIEGKIVVEFVVDADGTVHSPRIVKGLGFGCDEEAVKVLMLSPRWKPGTRRGQPVKMKTSIPFLFKLT